MIQLTEEEKKSHRKQTFCNICQTEFSYNDKNCYEVKDHCHYTRKYMSAAHNIFNLRKYQNKFLWYFIMALITTTIS